MEDYQVSCQWLAEHLSQENLIIFDATMKSGINQQGVESPVSILGARYFDFTNHVADKNSPLSNMMPNAEVFSDAVQELGVNQDSFIVVYDQQGLFSAARVWYMFKAMGFTQVAILQGGLPAWLKAALPTQSGYQTATQRGNFSGSLQKTCFVDKKYVLDAINDDTHQIVDARGYRRFSGQEADPRQGVRSGHIPNALNLHYASLIKDGQLLDKAELKTIFAELTPAPEQFIFSCGSGVTACILALAAQIVGHKNITVYDGSWSEWGKDKLLPIDSVT